MKHSHTKTNRELRTTKKSTCWIEVRRGIEKEREKKSQRNKNRRTQHRQIKELIVRHKSLSQTKKKKKNGFFVRFLENPLMFLIWKMKTEHHTKVISDLMYFQFGFSVAYSFWAAILRHSADNDQQRDYFPQTCIQAMAMRKSKNLWIECKSMQNNAKQCKTMQIQLQNLLIAISAITFRSNAIIEQIEFVSVGVIASNNDNNNNQSESNTLLWW